jgi:hypothetical protein
MKAMKHVVRFTMLLAVCMLMVACPEPASDLGSGGSEFDIFLGFPQDMDAASRSTINDDTYAEKVYAKVYDSLRNHLPAIDATSDISGVTQLRKNVSGTWSATVRLAEPASGKITFEVWAVTSWGMTLYAGETLHTVGTYNNSITIPTQAVSAIRSTGPAGGWLFYENSNWETDGWRYLEAASSNKYSSGVGYYHIFGYKHPLETASTETAVGTGAANTAKLVNSESGMGEEAYTTKTGTTTTQDYAAKLCDDHVEGGCDDWFLPSKDELNLMYLNLKTPNVGGFSTYYYWSSSESDGQSAWIQDFYDGNQYSYPRFYNIDVRPVRAF